MTARPRAVIIGMMGAGKTRVGKEVAHMLRLPFADADVEIGDGFLEASRPGSQAHDEIVVNADGRIDRLSNRAGGIEGGMSNGQVIRVRGAMKPIPSIPKALRTVDVLTGESAQAINQRSDSTAVPAASVVAEAMVRLTLAKYALDKFGGDSVAETRRNLESYLASWPEHMR